MARFWPWVKEVIADRGEEDPVPIHLERSHDGYAFRLGVRAGFGGQETARIPVHHRVNDSPHPILKEIHYCEVGGRTLEAANVFALRTKVAGVLDTLAPARTLPLCFFRAPQMDYELPVYEDGQHIVCPILGGPNLKARDLSSMRTEICRYLVSAGYVSEPDEVEVRVMRPRDLSSVPPACVFVSLSEDSFWVPAVEGVSAEGPVVGLVGHAAKISREARRRRFGDERTPSAVDVLSLLRYVRVDLDRARSGLDVTEVYAGNVRPDVWAQAQRHCQDSGTRLVAYLDGEPLELAVVRTGAGDIACALDHGNIACFLEQDEESLARCVGAYLVRAGYLRFPEEVQIEAAPPPRAERLEADQISTFTSNGFAASEPEEVRAQWN